MADKEKPEAEEEYESDLDDAPLPAVRRRAAASDDEGEDEDGGTPSRPRKAGSDADSDGQGAAEAYDEGAYEDGEEGYEEHEEAYEEFEEGGGGERGVAAEAVVEAGDGEGKAGDGDAEEADDAAAGEEKKGNEPYAVPTTGAFYMHDDRFQEARGRGCQRRMVNTRKLWNPKEEQAWVHDRFDEMNLHNFHGDNTKRKQGGRLRGRGGGPGGRTRGVSRGNFRGNRSRAYYHEGNKNYSYVLKESHGYHDNSKNAWHASYDNGKNRVPKLSRAHYDDVSNYDIVPKESHTYYSDAKSQKNAQRVVRGRGSRRYQPRWRSTTELSSVQNNKSQNENTPSNANLGKHQPQTSNSRPEQVLPVKQTIASNLNSASPPFYPSRLSHQELPVSQVGNGQPSSTGRPFSSSIGMENVSPTSQYGNLLRGKAFVPSVGHFEATMKRMNSPALHSSASSPNGPFPVAANQVTRDYVRPSHPIVQPSPVQSSTQSAPRMPALMFGAQFGGSDKMPSSVQPASPILNEDTEISSPSGSDKLNTQFKVKGQPGDLGEEHASFLYGGAHILGATAAMGLTLGDQGFHGTPALLPVMQFGGQRLGGPGVPSIGMALPGFVSQQQLGLSNSEMTWLPMLTGASGALGAPYGSPHIAVDGSYYSRPSEQASSSISLREPSGSNASSPLKSQEMTEFVSDELSQRQYKPRRYSEMNFGQ
ncbi:protein MLN51 homolog [Phragmites australis]|uniref:protein MLN51 homolog n=1 Tax=Phragmites australis TaxID=29695 RepID=UPI002D76A0DB|nr:protein MLN51 homolog [Phragmites australis]XP_062231981.1 protein MLN51 homolog [Phragmites australis]